MSAAKLSKQLQRELKANPQKAGMLGLLCVVAAYFWGPLVFKADETKKTTPTGAPTAAATTIATSPAAAATPAAPVGKERLEWRTLSKRLQTDPLMQSVAGKPAQEVTRNPFDVPVKKEDPTEKDDLLALLEEANEAGLLDDPQPVAPTQLMTSTALNAYPLFLTSTLVGPRARTAIINGKAYSAGAQIGKINEVELVLVSVDPRSALIAWNGARRELRIPKPGEDDPDAPTDEQRTNTNNQADDASNTETSAEAGEYLKSLIKDKTERNGLDPISATGPTQ